MGLTLRVDLRSGQLCLPALRGRRSFWMKSGTWQGLAGDSAPMGCRPSDRPW
jgi:hypothetical protein